AVRSTRAVTKRLAAPSPVDPLGGRLPRAADDERRCGDGHSGSHEISKALTLADGQDRICMKIHRSPPLGRDSLTSRTLGGLVATSRRQQRVWDLHLARHAIAQVDGLGAEGPRLDQLEIWPALALGVEGDATADHHRNDDGA